MSMGQAITLALVVLAALGVQVNHWRLASALERELLKGRAQADIYLRDELQRKLAVLGRARLALYGVALGMVISLVGQR